MWIFFALLSAVFFSLWQIVQKKIFQKESIIDFMVVQNTIIVLILIFFVPFIQLDIPLQTMCLIYAATVIAIFSSLLLFQAIKRSEVSSIAPLMNLTPIFLIFVAFFVLGELPTKIQIAGIVTIVIGAYALAVKSYRHIFTLYRFAEPRYIVYTIITAFSWAFVAVIARYVLQTITPYTWLFYFELFMFVNAIMVSAVTGRLVRSLGMVKRSWKIITVAGVLVVLSDLFVNMAMAFPTTLAALVVPIRRVSTLFSALLGGTLFHETQIMHKVISCIIMIVGIGLIAFG